jgi:hypothetical protein
MIRALATLFAFAHFGPAGAEIEDESASFSVAVKQNGRAIFIRDGEAILDRAPFEIVVKMGRDGGVLLDVSRDTGIFAALWGTDQLDEVPELQCGKAFAEDDFNPGEDLNVDLEGFHYLYVEGEKKHRFSSVERDADGWTCVRKVSAFRISHGKGGKSIPVAETHNEVLHLAFVRSRKFQTLRGETEMALQKELLTLRFRD